MIIRSRVVTGYTDQIEYVKSESYVPLLTPIRSPRRGESQADDLPTLRGQAAAAIEVIDLLAHARDRSEYQGE